LQDIRCAWEARDPDLVRLIEQLAEQPKPDTPIREGALTFRKFPGSEGGPTPTGRSAS
jgi:hypothetical protein